MTEAELPDDLRDFAAELQQLRPLAWNHEPELTDYRESVAHLVETPAHAVSSWLNFGGGLVVGALVGIGVAWSCFQAGGGRPTVPQQVVTLPPVEPSAGAVVAQKDPLKVTGLDPARRTAEHSLATHREPAVANLLSAPASGVTIGMLLNALDSRTGELPPLEEGLVAVSAEPAASVPVNTQWRLQKEYLKQPY